MDSSDLVKKVQGIVSQATLLKNKHTSELKAPVNYACIFSQDKLEFDSLKKIALTLGRVVEETRSGPLYLITPIDTVSGKLKLLKIRKPDITRPEEGDADFTVSDYAAFKYNYITKKGFKLIPREGWEMIELMDSAFRVRAYFSSEPLDKQIGVLNSEKFFQQFSK
jgi:hypothetical protein